MPKEFSADPNRPNPSAAMSAVAAWQDPDTMVNALRQRRVAVVGMSSKTTRDSNSVGHYLLRHGYQIIPVNPREETIYGLTCYPDLESVPHQVDVVNVFRESAAVPAIAEAAAAIKARYLWLQLGVINPAGVAIAEAAGLHCIVDKCIKVKHARYRSQLA